MSFLRRSNKFFIPWWAPFIWVASFMNCGKFLLSEFKLVLNRIQQHVTNLMGINPVHIFQNVFLFMVIMWHCWFMFVLWPIKCLGSFQYPWCLIICFLSCIYGSWLFLLSVELVICPIQVHFCSPNCFFNWLRSH